MKRFFRRPGFAVLLSLLLPGLGHIYWGEYLFGLFIFLVMIIASVLVFFTFLATLPVLLLSVLLILPLIFYIFSFVDLTKSIRRKRATFARSDHYSIITGVVAIASNLLVPLSPTNFLLRNLPGVESVQSAGLEPYLEPETMCLVDRTAYRVNLFFLDYPYVHKGPARWDLVAFSGDNGRDELGLTVGLEGEELSWYGELNINGTPVNLPSGLPPNALEIPLTRVEAGSILVVTLGQEGPPDYREVSGRNVVGKVHPIF